MVSSIASRQPTYADAVAALNTLQSNFAVINAIKESGRSLNQQAIPEMIEWCRKLGYEPSSFDYLRLIHIAGTKGKGSTGAFVSSILAQYHPSPGVRYPERPITKIGLYTSPHLRFVRERIRINNESISERLFANYFFEIWHRFEIAARKEGKPTDTAAKPVYFRFLTLLALHTYLKEGVDTAVIECGIGGEYDSTNILVSPTTVGITSLGIDHTALLGSTIEAIAWHKAGIMKAGAPVYTAPQPASAMSVLKKRAEEKGVDLQVVDEDPRLSGIDLGLAADFQKINASLAIQLAASHLTSLGYPNPIPDANSPLPEQFIDGFKQVRWPGRCEVRRESGIRWHIDGGHTLESIRLAGEWFASQVSSAVRPKQDNTPRFLLFNQQTRDAPALAKALHETLARSLGDQKPFSHVVFCTNVTSVNAGYRPDLSSSNMNGKDVQELTVQKMLKATWVEMDPQTVVEVKGTVEEAVQWVRDVVDERRGGGEKGDTMALVTGSLHLVGGFLDILEGAKDS